MKIYDSIEQLVGNTPLVRLKNLEKSVGAKAQILAKLEYLNPAGSIKDRVALAMINDFEEKGMLRPGSVIIEPTSGNTGIGLAAIAAVRGYEMIVVMPDSMSEERRKIIAAYGAKLVLTDGKDGMSGSIAEAERLKAEIPGSVIAGQFVNPSNPDAHFASTGPEIMEDTDGEADILVAGVGTGGTLTGTGRYLKSVKPEIKVIAVEPSASPLLSGGKAGAHGLQGIGANFIPDVLDTEVYDEVIPVSDEEAYEYARCVCKKEGILVGISAGAALCAAVKAAKRPENDGKKIVVILPDTGDRYLSTPLFEL